MARSLSVLAGAGWQFFDNNGDPLSGGKIYSYDAGTTTPRATYSTSSGGSANANPIVLDAAGRPSSGGSPIEVWLDTGVLYKLVITDANGANILTYDNVYGVSGGAAADVIFTPSGVGGIATTVQAKLDQYVSLSDYGTLRQALETGKAVKIPAATGSISVSTTDSAYILQNLNRVQADGPLTLNLAAGAHTAPTVGNSANIGYNGNITILGAAPVETTLTSVHSVTGTKGNYTVVYNVASVAGFNSSGYLKLDNIIPQFTLGGDNSFFHDRIAANELGFCVGPLQGATIAAGGTTVTFTGDVGAYLAVGDLITIAGQTREITAVGPGGGLTAKQVSVGTAWRMAAVATRGWWVCTPNSGTISTAGSFSTTVTGSSTDFTNQANVGDFVLAAGQMAVITAIGSGTSLTVSPGLTVPASTKYSIITAGFAHEGTHQIVSVDTINNRVTVLNKWNGPYAPPIKAVGGGAAGLDMNKVSCVKTVLANNGTGDGFSFAQGGSINFINDLVIVGNADSITNSYIGVNLAGRRAEGPTQLNNVSSCVTGDNFAAINWYTGGFAGNGCVLESRRSHYMNSFFNIYALEGATVNAREAVLANAGYRNAQINSNSTLLFTNGRALAATESGVQLESGATVYAELPFAYGNAAQGFAFYSASGCHINEFTAALNGASAVYMSAAASADLQRGLVVCNTSSGVDIVAGSVAAVSGIWTTGNRTVGSSHGISIDNSSAVAGNGGSNGLVASLNNGGYSIYVTGSEATFEAPYSYLVGITTGGTEYGVYAVSNTRVRLSSSVVNKIYLLTGNTVYADDVYVVAGSPTRPVVRVSSGSPYDLAFDQTDGFYNIVSSGSGASFGARALQIAAGANITKLQTYAATINVSPTAGSFVDTVFNSGTSPAISGVTTSDMVLIGVQGSSTVLPNGITVNASVTAANEITVRIQNSTGGTVAVNRAFRLIVLGAS